MSGGHQVRSAVAVVAPGCRREGALDRAAEYSLHDRGRPQPGSLPSEVKGFKLQEVRDLSLRVPVPANSSYVSASLDGGSGLNSTPTVELDHGVAVIKVAGPIAGGANYQLPGLSIRLKSGRRGSVIETRLKGTSYDDPGPTLQANIKWKFITITSPVSCYPDPNPPLTTTTVR